MFSIIHTYIHSHTLIRIHIFTHDLLAQRSIGKYITEKKYVCVYTRRQREKNWKFHYKDDNKIISFILFFAR